MSIPVTTSVTHFDAGIVYTPYIPLTVTREEPEMLYAEGINPIIMDEHIRIWGQRDLGVVRVVEDDFQLTQFWVDEAEELELMTEGDRYRYRLGI